MGINDDNYSNRVGIYDYLNQDGLVENNRQLGKGNSIKHYNINSKVVQAVLKFFGIATKVNIRGNEYLVNKNSFAKFRVRQEYIKSSPDMEANIAKWLDYFYTGNYRPEDTDNEFYKNFIRNAKMALNDKANLNNKLRELKEHKNQSVDHLLDLNTEIQDNNDVQENVGQKNSKNNYQLAVNKLLNASYLNRSFNCSYLKNFNDIKNRLACDGIKSIYRVVNANQKYINDSGQQVDIITELYFLARKDLRALIRFNDGEIVMFEGIESVNAKFSCTYRDMQDVVHIKNYTEFFEGRLINELFYLDINTRTSTYNIHV